MLFKQYDLFFNICTTKSIFPSFSGKFVVCKAAGQGKKFERAIGVTEDCLFPFKHNGKQYNGCVPSADGKEPLCATKVDNKGIMQKWARCNGVCNTDKGTIYSFIVNDLFFNTLRL